MKLLDRFQFLANVLIVACSRPNAEVGKLVKALVTYATEGTRTDLGDLRLEAYFDLIAQDMDSQRRAAEQKSRQCSESAKCRTAARNSGSANSPAKRANVANTTSTANSSNATTAKQKAIAEVPTESPDDNTSNDAGIEETTKDFNASEATSSFDRMKECYKKTGDNESQAFGVWQQLSEDERSSAFAYAQRLQGDLSSRTYLYVYLRDKEWTKATSPVNR